MTDAETILAKLKEIECRADKATQGPLIGLHTKHISDCKDELLESLKESIENSIKHDGGHAWHWIETKDGCKIAEFGCGPTSEKNMEFYGHARTDVPALTAALKRACEQLRDEVEAGSECAAGALAEIAAILKGET